MYNNLVVWRCRLVRSRAHDWKSCNSETSSRVRISPSPPACRWTQFVFGFSGIFLPLWLDRKRHFFCYIFTKIPNASAFGIFTYSLFTYPRIRNFWKVRNNSEKCSALFGSNYCKSAYKTQTARGGRPSRCSFFFSTHIIGAKYGICRICPAAAPCPM